MAGAWLVITRTPPAQSMASTVVSAWLLAVTRSLYPKCPVASNVIPLGVTVPGRLAKRLARPSAPIEMMPGRPPGCRAKIMPLRNEHPVLATRPFPATVTYGSGPSAVE
jgi:hypothetical protein